MKMKNSDLFAGSILAGLLTYSGEFKEIIPIYDSEMEKQREIGEMSDLEKTVYSVIISKAEEAREIIEKLTGLTAVEISQDDFKRAGAILSLGENAETVKKCEQLKSEAANLKTIMWSLIRSRIPAEEPARRILPGYKIVAGYEEEDILNMILGGSVRLFGI